MAGCDGPGSSAGTECIIYVYEKIINTNYKQENLPTAQE
jgi:hypothetical protein